MTSPWGQVKADSQGLQHRPLGDGADVPSPLVSPGSAPQDPNYDEVQRNEMEALRSIFGDDFEEAQKSNRAWNRSSDHSFKLRLRATTNSEVSVTLYVIFTATYPKSVPVFQLEDEEDLRKVTKEKLSELLEVRPKTLLNSEMIFDISILIQEVLEDDALLKALEPNSHSLEEERKLKEDIAALKAQREQEELEKQKEQERIMKDILSNIEFEEERVRRNKRRASEAISTALAMPQSSGKDSPDQLCLDQSVDVKDEKGHLHSFSVVKEIANLHQGPVTRVLTVRPITFSSNSQPPILVVKHVDVKSSPSKAVKAEHIQALEKELESLRKLSHPNVLALHYFRVYRSSENELGEETWKITLLLDFANQGSLESHLYTFGPLAVFKIRSWTIQLLEALEFYHDHGICHRSLHAGNVLISHPNRDDSAVIKLADGCYQEIIRGLKESVQRPAKNSQSKTWLAPELLPSSDDIKYSRKTDIWDLAVVFLQMIFGVEVKQKYATPNSVIEHYELSTSTEDFIRKMIKTDPKKRLSAFDLLPSEFLRSSTPIDAPVSQDYSKMSMTSSLVPHNKFDDPRRESFFGPTSRYNTDFTELGVLGKGGYGLVVKAKNKLDGRHYAVKKIILNSESALDEILSEVRLLSKLNHPYVVRYFNAWQEHQTTFPGETDEGSSCSESNITPTGPSIEFINSKADFLSSSGYPQISFGPDEEDDEYPDCGNVVFEESSKNGEESGENGEAELAESKLSLRSPRPFKVTLYIQMEYCEKRTLRDLIKNNLHANIEETWKLFRQILEGLSHIHDNNIIHRDLKPDNVFIDNDGNPRIGDFGLARNGRFDSTSVSSEAAQHDDNLTRSIGTALYVAPEVRSNVKGDYDIKVDMYSLGIIFFEMCYPIKTSMERADKLILLRDKKHSLPKEFLQSNKIDQGSIIKSLISHNPKERPTCVELLQSGKLPFQVEDTTIRHALQGLSDPNSPYHRKMISALFSQKTKAAQDYAWDRESYPQSGVSELLLKTTIKETLSSIFRRHGAVETSMPLLCPHSNSFDSDKTVQLLDSSGTLVQLPLNLVVPHVRVLSRVPPRSLKSFVFGTVYGQTATGGQPLSFGEVNFDIVSHNSADLALKEAEVIKVIDEIINTFPSLQIGVMYFHINHSDLLDLILEYCRIDDKKRRAVKDTLSKRHTEKLSWEQIRQELRSSHEVPATCLDDLSKFEFREVPMLFAAKLKSLFKSQDFQNRGLNIYKHIEVVLDYLALLGVTRKIYIYPLDAFNAKFYEGGLLFQCLYDQKQKNVFAAGGRYDQLILDERSKVQNDLGLCHAVGFSFIWERLLESMVKYLNSPSKALSNKKYEYNSWAARRCDVLIASFDPIILRSTGLKTLNDLWTNNISAELAVDARSYEELSSHYRTENFQWIIIIKNELATERNIKIRNIAKKEDTELKSSDLLGWLKNDMKERDNKESRLANKAITSPDETRKSSDLHSNQDVRILFAHHHPKKISRSDIFEAAILARSAVSHRFLDSPTVAIEIRDDILDRVHASTRMSDKESWDKVIKTLQGHEKKYFANFQDLLKTICKEGRFHNCFIYNFKTGKGTFYDLAA
ncbi:MAG: hypothetical protein M1829_004149 [Trizodia sp. TS-e1964]|nr:MAG: hypothetical protein M1829_004149 [Trizodia sp. TS-e1964]